MRVLVTGGSGYIGSHTCIELLNAGHDVIVLDNFSNSKRDVINKIEYITNKKIKLYEYDLIDENDIDEVFHENEISSVLHLAGYKSVGESVTNPLKYYQNNIIGTINLCNVMKKYNVKKLVFSSSATVYGIPNLIPIAEDSNLRAINPYGRSKLIIEEMLRDFYNSDSSLSIVLLRYFNPVGAHFSGLIGEEPSGVPNNLTPYITQVALGKLKELKIFGDDYETIDGTGVRDYIHVEDLAKGHLKAIERVSLTTGIESYNLGTGKGYTVLEVVREFEKVIGRKIPYKVVGRREGDVAICYADVSKAMKELGWTAEKSIEEMCADAWRWQINNPDGYEKKKEVIKL